MAAMASAQLAVCLQGGLRGSVPAAATDGASEVGRVAAAGAPKRSARFAAPQRLGRWSPAKATLANEVAPAPAVADTLAGESDPVLGWDRPAWAAGYRSQTEETAYRVDDIEGEVPRELQGTFLRNGPGKFEIGEQRLMHPFDGDGMVASFAIRDGKVFFRNRFVRTEGFVAESAAGKVLYRNSFGTQRAGGPLANALDLSQKNVANTNVIVWGGKCLALWEAMQPYRLDPETLETLGEDMLGGVLKPGVGFSTGQDWLDELLPGAGGEPFTAHPHVDAARRRLVGFGSKFVPGAKPAESTNDTVLTFYEFDEDFGLVSKTKYKTDGFTFAHDFCFTENYYIVFQAPVSYNPLPFLLGMMGPAECLSFHAERQVKIHIIPRPDGAAAGQPTRVVEGGSLFAFHHANAYETEDGASIIIDTVCLDKMNDFGATRDKDWLDIDFAELPLNQIWRHTVDLAAGTATLRQLDQRLVEFPLVNGAVFGRQHRFVYCGASRHPTRNQPLASWMKLDCDTGAVSLFSRDIYTYFGEPLFVPRPGGVAEDDGWLIGLCFDGKNDRTDLVIVDAKNLEAGAVAVCHLKGHLPYGLHGCFTPQYFGPAEL